MTGKAGLTTKLAAALAGTALAGLALPASAENVTFARLMNADAEPQNWLMVDFNYSQHRNSPLTNINKSNVRDMVPLYAVGLCGWVCTPRGFIPDARAAGGRKPGEQAIPLVADGFMYIEDGLSKVSKIDVRSGNRGTFVWRYDPEITSYRNRKGVALLNDKVHVCVGTPRAVALDMHSGEVVYDTDLWADVQPGTTAIAEIINQTMTGPPLTVQTAAGRNVHICGRGGQHSGNHSIDAVDADTGEFIWRRYSVPAPGEPGHQTWENDAWMVTSIGFWGHHAFDPETNTLITGTGDVWPSYDPEFRPGDNLFGGSTMAIDVDTGEIKWYFQAIPNERYDVDSVNNRHIWTTLDGRRVVSNFERLGHWYVFDLDAGMATNRTNPQGAGMPNIGAFVRAHQYTDEVTWTAGIDPKTGMPLEYDSNLSIQTYLDFPGGGTPRENVGVEKYLCPSWSAQNVGMEPSVMDMGRRTAFAIVNDACRTGRYITEVHDDVPIAETLFNGEGPRPCCWTGTTLHRGFSIVAMAIDTGERTKIYKDATARDNDTGVIGTDGGLLMTGWSNGKLAVYDKDTGVELWSFNIGADLHAAPMTFSVDGNQYFALVAGGNTSTSNVGGVPAQGRAFGGSPVVWVFGLRN
jgi:alcohol dehydrogenase (cytochrome c)